MPKQTDIDKMLEVIQRKVLIGTHLPVEIKEIQTVHLHSSYFKDIYLYLSQNKLPSSKVAIKREEALAEKYILLDSLLVFCRKDLCEARVKPEMSSNFQMTFSDIPPCTKLPVPGREVFADICCQ